MGRWPWKNNRILNHNQEKYSQMSITWTLNFASLTVRRVLLFGAQDTTCTIFLPKFEMGTRQTTDYFSTFHQSTLDQLGPSENRFRVFLINGFCFASLSFKFPKSNSFDIISYGKHCLVVLFETCGSQRASQHRPCLTSEVPPTCTWTNPVVQPILHIELNERACSGSSR